MTRKEEIIVVGSVTFPLIVGMLAALFFGIYGGLFIGLFFLAVMIIAVYWLVKSLVS